MMDSMHEKQQASSGTSTPYRHNPFDTPALSSAPTQDKETGYFPPVKGTIITIAKHLSSDG
jgi:hypothetical protein